MDNIVDMGNRLDQKKWRKWLRELEADPNYSPNLAEIDRIIATWKANSPRMYRRLKQQMLLQTMAKVLQAQAWEEEDRLLASGMSPTDAREIAEREHLMLEPEEEPEYEIAPEPTPEIK